jgi:DNA-binding beta-propeller fold protein YncE
MDYPRGIAIDPDTQRVWVANTRQHVIRVYQHDGTYLFTIGDGEDSNDADSFRWPMDVEFYGGKAYVSDYYGTYLKILDASTGALLDQIGLTYGPYKIPSTGVAVDPATGNIYILSWDLDQVFEYSPDGDTLIRSFGSTGSGDGQFQNPWDMDIIDGQLYVVDAKLSRISVFGLDGTFVGKWGTKGSKPFQYLQPSGITHDDAGNIYIADANNDRVLVYNLGVALPSGDIVKPTVTIGSPLNNSVAPAQTLFVTGTAADNAAVGKVEFAVQNRVTGKWWNATLAIWQNTRVFGIAALAGSASTSVTYRFPFIGVNRGGDYTVQVRSMDTSNLVSAIKSVHVTLMS